MIPAARHIQVETAIPVGIEEQGSPVLVRLVGHPWLASYGFDEAAIALLQEQVARDACRATDEHIIQAVAIDVAHGKGRALAGKRIR